MPNELLYSTIETPVGRLIIYATNDGICLLNFDNPDKLSKVVKSVEDYFGMIGIEGENAIILQLKKELLAYFEGTLQEFAVPTIFTGTAFQNEVWEALLTIPYGVTRTYKEQTAVLGDPKAIRAVASANGKNKLAIIVPCHRVIGSDGSLTGYAGGLERKRFLLNLERQYAGPKDLFSI